jgi:hypothetical protein
MPDEPITRSCPTCGTLYVDCDPCNPDGSVIASAQRERDELLEALNGIVELYGQCAIDLPHDVDGDNHKLFHAAHAIIARIEGNT